MHCDRCKRYFPGTLGADGDMTVGYYDVWPPSLWCKFRNFGERIVCDHCMWADPRYIAVYGQPRPQTTDCRSEEGITVGLVDALIAVIRVLAHRDLSPQAVQEALLDLVDDEDLKRVLCRVPHRRAA